MIPSRGRGKFGLLKVLTAVGLISVVLGVGLTGMGQNGWLRQELRSLKSLGQAIWASRSVAAYSRGDFTNVIFLHQSVGNNLIDQGGVRERLAAAGIDFWDHAYNEWGLRDPAGRWLRYNYAVPGDNTDIDGMAAIFSQTPYSLPVNTFSALLQYEVIIFKSCFPNSHIATDEQLEADKAYYRSMRATMDRYPQKLFIIVAQPPLNPAETNPQAASRARALVTWLASDEFLASHPNVQVFDFFDYLAEADPGRPDFNMLKENYRDGADSHPNRQANEELGPIFADFVVESVRDYQSANR